MNSFYDFTDSTTGHPIYYKILSAQEKTVAIWPKSIISYNDPEGELVLPEFVKYKEEKYRLVSIGANAFKNNKRLLSVTLPKSVTVIGENAFYGCFSLESIRVGENVEMVAEGLYLNLLFIDTSRIIPGNYRDGFMDFIYKRFEFMLQDSKNIGLAGYAIYHLADDLLKDKVTPDDHKAFYWYLKGHILADSVYAECNLAEAAACFRQALEKGGAVAAYRLGLLYYWAGDYRNAYDFYVRAADAEILEADNQLALWCMQRSVCKMTLQKLWLLYRCGVISAWDHFCRSELHRFQRGNLPLMMGQRDKAAVKPEQGG
ncbi:MAG: leucine-rich repeat protein [Eubacterium ramulus]